ncbi:RHS domain-containing protein [Methylomonas sp. MED-D]|uniref:RHS domain-containing protein n=1 Tax=Methylomonas sp. MED-D TaxID=3418768 RepID=UPI003D0674BB
MALHEQDNTQASGTVYHYHLDHLGTPRELTNNQGHIVWSARYRAYGNLPGSRRSHRQPATYPRQVLRPRNRFAGHAYADGVLPARRIFETDPSVSLREPTRNVFYG